MVGEGALRELGQLLPPRAGPGLLVTDTAVGPLWAEEALGVLRGAGRTVETIALPAGEEAKSFAGFLAVVEALERAAVTRDGWVVALGGGVVGDVAGFAAAVWLRGIAYYQVPTTLLAMVDSSVGGKTGINVRAKNSVGAFWQPSAVISDLRLLGTLPDAAYLDGFAEIIKYGVALDAGLFRDVVERAPALRARETQVLQRAITRCASLKAALVFRDERDEGERAVLNYGHTVAHALERLSGYTLRHGAAVATGMRAAARMSARLQTCDGAVVAELDGALSCFGLGDVAGHFTPSEVLEATRSDKKTRTGKTRWVLLRTVGQAEPGHEVPDDVALAALSELL